MCEILADSDSVSDFSGCTATLGYTPDFSVFLTNSTSSCGKLYEKISFKLCGLKEIKAKFFHEEKVGIVQLLLSENGIMSKN